MCRSRLAEGVGKVAKVSFALGRVCMKVHLEFSPFPSLSRSAKLLCQVCDDEKHMFFPAKLSGQGRNRKGDFGSETAYV